MRQQQGMASAPFSPAGTLPALFSFFLGSSIDLSVPDNLISNPIDGLLEVGLFQLALPDYDDAPTFRLQLSPHFLIPLLIASHVIQMQRIIKMRISLFW